MLAQAALLVVDLKTSVDLAALPHSHNIIRRRFAGKNSRSMRNAVLQRTRISLLVVIPHNGFTHFHDKPFVLAAVFRQCSWSSDLNLFVRSHLASLGDHEVRPSIVQPVAVDVGSHGSKDEAMHECRLLAFGAHRVSG